MNLTHTLEVIVGKDINLTVPWFLMASYLYYKEDISLFADYEFDILCRYMLEHYDKIDHYHKDLVTKEGLRAGTGFDIQYPLIVKGAALQYAKERGLL